jgi:hypothetical protein
VVTVGQRTDKVEAARAALALLGNVGAIDADVT